ncbi:MAG: TonB-dependent receptor domain-containing protein, partial [Ktedonobacteraceae bacterium]
MLSAWKVFASLVGLGLIAAILSAQQVNSSAITGTVTDPSGAVVPNATVVVTNEATKVSRSVQTNNVGLYLVPYIVAGSYSVSVTASGFKTYRESSITVKTGTTVRNDAMLSTGSVNTSVEVKANAAHLQTESSTVEGAVSQNFIATLPNANNNPLYYATLVAGVVASPQVYDSTTLGVGFGNRQKMSAIRINGGELGTNDIQLNGLSVQGASWHSTTIVPNRDALQEVRVTTNDFSADLGDAQGVISMITKSGTNQFHGDLNYKLRNEALNANGLYNNEHGIARGEFRVNEGGGSIGGPVIIPKLFNGKDKMFFFVSLMRLTHTEPVSYLTTVPTEAQRNGDFSQTMVADNNGNPVPVQLFNPFTAAPYEGSSTVFVRQPYPNAIITDPDPYGLKLLQAYPKANHPPTDAFGNNNYEFDGNTPTVRNSLTTRLDYHINADNSLFLVGGFSRGSIDQPNRWGSDNPFVSMGFGGNTNDNNPYASMGYTAVLSPTTVLDFRYGITRVQTNSSFPAGTGFDYSAYGMPTNVQSLVAMYGTPTSVLNFGGPIGNLNYDQWDRKEEAQLIHEINGSVTKVAGKWTLKAGGDLRVYLGNWQDIFSATPELNGSVTTGELGTLTGTNSSLISDPAMEGIPFATALTGVTGYKLPSGTTTRPALAAKYFAFFSQNDWRATNKLTINLGLRYDVQPGPTERYDHISGVDLSQPNPYAMSLNSTNPLAGMGAIEFPGTSGYSRNLWDTEWGNISPRLGAAYELTNSTVLRGGFGRTYVPSNTGFNANGLIYGTGPFSGGAQSIPYGLTPSGLPIGRFEDPQNTLVLPAMGAVQAPNLYGDSNASLNVDLFPRNYQVGKVDQWNFFVQHSFGHAWLVSAGYVGSHGSNLPWRGFPLNGVFDIPDSTLQSWRNTWYNSDGLNDPASVQVSNPLPALIGEATGPIGAAKISALNAQMPYLAFLGQTVLATNEITNYNALQVRVEHAYSNGFQLMANYTWSKATGLGGGYSGGFSHASYAESQIAGGGAAVSGGPDYRNLNNNRGLLGYDTPQRAVIAVTYLLPTGQGRALYVPNRILRGVVGGWQLGGVITLQSGQPWGPDCASSMNERCDVVPGESLEVPKALQHWYDGKTSVTLPDGRVVTPPAFSYLKWNPDYFAEPVAQFPNGKYAVDQYWNGTTSQYVNGLRLPAFENVNLTVRRDFRITESTKLEFMAEATNLLNRTNFLPTAVNGTVGAVLQSDAASNTKVGQNSNVSFGTLGMDFYEP